MNRCNFRIGFLECFAAESNFTFVHENLCQKLLFLLASTNPQYDKRLFIDLPVQYMKTTSSEHVVYINCFFVFVLTFKKMFTYSTTYLLKWNLRVIQISNTIKKKFSRRGSLISNTIKKSCWPNCLKLETEKRNTTNLPLGTCPFQVQSVVLFLCDNSCLFLGPFSVI